MVYGVSRGSSQGKEKEAKVLSMIHGPLSSRLSPSKLEERDLYFHKLKLNFETTLKHRGGPSIVSAHSFGNNVFRCFLEWLKLEFAPKKCIQWLVDRIHAHFVVGSPLLGSVQTVEATLSGSTFGLPLPEEGHQQITWYDQAV
ncbi:unnamed protein product [Lactuca virosa]|uniref:Uncharacterized protein n=1 Tax=Lactuca virosa TaxID=75947 RepID=A0AAU9N0J3_9ASTR|nr:unnamed protein product [Lactuca virosa]